MYRGIILREINFRAWDSWLNKYLNRVTDIILNIGNGEVHGMMSTGNVPEWTLEQFNGLRDKNGKEIYEGNIVRDYDEGFLYKVMFCEYHAQFMFYDYLNDDYYDDHYDDQDIAEHEIIGNIHENPELLEASC